MLRDVYSAEKNPNGIINMGIANNSLMQDELLEVSSNGMPALGRDGADPVACHNSTFPHTSL